MRFKPGSTEWIGSVDWLAVDAKGRTDGRGTVSASTVPVEYDRVGHETRIPVYAKLDFAMTPRGKLELYTGVAAGGELRLENKHGKKFEKRITMRRP